MPLPRDDPTLAHGTASYVSANPQKPVWKDGLPGQQRTAISRAIATTPQSLTLTGQLLRRRKSKRERHGIGKAPIHHL